MVAYTQQTQYPEEDSQKQRKEICKEDTGINKIIVN